MYYYAPVYIGCNLVEREREPGIQVPIFWKTQKSTRVLVCLFPSIPFPSINNPYTQGQPASQPSGVGRIRKKVSSLMNCVFPSTAAI
jgi:hypothetical protein